MTEDEAKTKWCPFARVVDSARGTDGEGARCIGSACMAWRWLTSPEVVAAYPGSVADGYCGLAGRPA